MFQNMFGF